MSISIAWSGPRFTRYQRAGVDADLVDQLVEEDDVAAPLRHLGRLAALREVDELVDQHLDPLGILAEQRRGGLQAADVAVVVCTQHVDRAVEATRQLVACIGEVGGVVRVAAVGAFRRRGPCRRRSARSAPRPPRRPRRSRSARAPPGSPARSRSAAPRCRSGCGSARASPRSTRASAAPGRRARPRARRRRRPCSRPRAAPPRAGAPRPSRGSGPSASPVSL